MSIAISTLAAILLQSAPLNLPAEPFEPVLSAELRQALEQQDDSDPEEFVRKLEELGDAGDMSALELLGEMHQLSLFGVKRDMVRACNYYERVGRRRADALHNMATCYFNGDGRDHDFVKARELYRSAAQAGWVTSLCALGNMLVRGQGGEVDAEQGIMLCRLAADAGDRDAQTDLGGYLLTGEGVTRDPVEAHEYLLAAGQQGQVNASLLLGQMYARGDGVEADTTASREWLELAYEGGRLDAAYHLMRSHLRAAVIEGDGPRRIRSASVPTILKWADEAAMLDPKEDRRNTAAAIAAELRGG